jgi:transposase-like protein
MTDLTNPIFTDETAARQYLEAQRWPDGPVCPHCGSVEVSKLDGKAHRPGVYQCNGCRQQFTVTVGSVFERSKIPLHKWLLATHLLTASKKGMSAHQLHRMLGLTYKTAWFMAHRIREAMKDESPSPMGGPGGSVQADETYFGTKASGKEKGIRGTYKRGPGNKRAVVSLVSGGKARTFHVAHADAQTVRGLLVANVRRESELHTDESRLYVKVGEEFAAHKTVNHTAGEYVGPSGQSTNKVENYFSIFKRGMKGVYQHCAEKHLQRYINEFDFRYNNREIADSERRDKALAGAEGKRLTYRRIGNRANV